MDVLTNRVFKQKTDELAKTQQRSKMLAASPKKFTEESNGLCSETGPTVPRRKPVSGAALSFRFIAGKAEDDRAVACGKSVTPCHQQGHAPSSSVLM